MTYGTYLMLSLLGFFLSVGASLFTSFTFNRFKNTPASRNVTPLDFAREVTEKEGLDITVETVSGQLSDHYDPRGKVVRLSAEGANYNGLSQLTVTAHELGHALQDKNKGLLFIARTALAGLVGISTNIGYFMLIIGLALSILDLAYLGLILFSAATVFMILTVPIEIDASVRGMGLLKKYQVIIGDEVNMARLLLIAAASTYLVAFLQTLLQFLYFASMVTGRRRSE